jgi:hypothetical protein
MSATVARQAEYLRREGQAVAADDLDAAPGRKGSVRARQLDFALNPYPTFAGAPGCPPRRCQIPEREARIFVGCYVDCLKMSIQEQCIAIGGPRDHVVGGNGNTRRRFVLDKYTLAERLRACRQ